MLLQAATLRRLFDQSLDRRRSAGSCRANLVRFDSEDGILYLTTYCAGSKDGPWDQLIEIVSWPALSKLILSGPETEEDEEEEEAEEEEETAKPDEQKRRQDLLKRFKMGQAQSSELQRTIDFSEVRSRFLRELNAADVRVFCACPDFLYSGAQWKATQLKVVPSGKEESRAPQPTYAPADPAKRRRQQYKQKARSILCKHLVAVYDDHFR